MTTVKIGLGDFAKLLHQAPGEITRAAVAGIQDAAMQGVGIVVDEIQQAGKVDTGELVQSTSASPESNGATISVSAPYAGVVDQGRRPGAKAPPLEAIYEWVIRKGIAEESGEEDGKGPAWQIARAIQRAIGRNGIEPTRFMEKSLLRIKPIAEAAVKRYIAEVL